MKTSQSAWHSVRLVHVNGLKGAKLTWLDRVGYPMNSVGTVPTEFCRFCEKRGISINGKKLNGKGGSMSVYGMKIDNKTDSFEDYLPRMETSEQELIKEIKAYI